MAMEVRRTIADAHDQAILCVAYNAQRREIFTGKAVTGLAADLEKLELSLKTKYDDAAPKGGGRAGGRERG